MCMSLPGLMPRLAQIRPCMPQQDDSGGTSPQLHLWVVGLSASVLAQRYVSDKKKC